MTRRVRGTRSFRDVIYLVVEFGLPGFVAGVLMGYYSGYSAIAVLGGSADGVLGCSCRGHRPLCHHLIDEATD